jgi:GDPmannose 4,6-dehydratase
MGDVEPGQTYSSRSPVTVRSALVRFHKIDTQMEGKLKRALICGVSGQDGSYLSDLLLSEGYEVWGTSRDADSGLLSNLTKLGLTQRVHLVSMVPSDFRSVYSALSRSDPHEVYYLAGQSSVGLSFELPAETITSILSGVMNILEAIRMLNPAIRLYNAGSSECFGDTGPNAASETTPFQPRSPYAVAKASAHWLVRNYRESYGLYCCTGILFNHESPLRPERFVTRKIVSGAAGIAAGRDDRLILGKLDIARDWGWAPEYVEAMRLMLQQEEANDYVIATGKTARLAEFVAEAFAFYGLDWRDHVVSSSEYTRPSDIDISRADPRYAKKKLGWKARSHMEEVVRRMCEANGSSQLV